MSVNYFVTRCVRKYLDWDLPSMHIGMVSVPKMLLAKLSKDADGETLEMYGREVARNWVKLGAEYITGTFSVASAIEILNRTSLYGGRFSFDFVDGADSTNHVLVVRHDEEPQWSMYYVGLLEETFKVLLGEETKVAYTDTLCILQMAAH
jgi:hypothetical protein